MFADKFIFCQTLHATVTIVHTFYICYKNTSKINHTNWDTYEYMWRTDLSYFKVLYK